MDEAAVAAALTEGHLGGAALDVFGIERSLAHDNPLIIAKEKGANLILTPHIGQLAVSSSLMLLCVSFLVSLLYYLMLLS